MIVDKRLFIKEGLVENDNFIIETSNTSLTISKKMNFNNFFEFVIIAYDQAKPVTLICDKIVYNSTNYFLDVLNTSSMTRPDHVIATHRIEADQNVSLYSFGEYTILMVINKEE